MVRAVFLDLGDTLVHLDRPWEEVFRTNLLALCGYLAKSGLRFDTDKFTETFCRMFDDASSSADLYKIEVPMEEIISKVLRKSRLQLLGIDLPAIATMEFYGPEIDAWQLFPDTIETLVGLNEDGYDLAVVSNAKSDWAVRAIVERCDMRKFVKAIVSSAALKVRKPRSEIFNQALKALDVKPRDSVFVGDSLQADVGGANNMGMRSIHVRRKLVDASLQPKADATVSSLSEALQVIRKWNNGTALQPSAKSANDRFH